jgi:hypothetical protein
MTYLVLFEDATGSIGRDTLRAALERDWPTAELSTESSGHTPSEVRAVEWTYTAGPDTIEGRSHIDGTCIYLDGQLNLAAEFAAWFRSLVRKACPETSPDRQAEISITLRCKAPYTCVSMSSRKPSSTSITKAPYALTATA